MKRLLYLAILFANLAFTGCSDVAVGYLFTDDAAYSIDTLYITRFSSLEGKIEELEGQFDLYSDEINELIAQTTPLEEELVEAKVEEERLLAIRKEYEKALRNASEADKPYYEQLVNEADAEYQAWKSDVTSPLEVEIYHNKNNIIQLCDELGLLDPDTIEEEVAQIRAQIDEDIPWTTSQIEQLLGTEPLSYSLVGVKSSNGQETVDDFVKYLTVIGGGRMYVDAKVDSPKGSYTVSLKVENEGHSAILEDIFTFVLL